MLSSFHVFLVLSVITLRLLVALHPHSGQDNYHGSVKAYGGDYEAQRHWLELTLHLPLRQWYTHDVHYWGLDYPPLTAYVSYACGLLSHWLVGPETVALYSSRFGYLDRPSLLYYADSTHTHTNVARPIPIQYTHKAFMRFTVLLLDVSIYFTAVWILAQRLAITQSTSTSTRLPRCHDNDDDDDDATTLSTDRVLVFRFIFITALIQPSLILIDHGHFQYNSVCLGLSLWSFHYMTHRRRDTNDTSFYYCILASIFFCLALNFKQMTLYYAPAVFSYLLGRCLANGKQHPLFKVFFLRIALLGITVLFTFFVLWYPFVYYRDPQRTSAVQSLLIILQRLFPFQRGMFEGKVSNIWCSLSIRPISIRSRIPIRFQPWAALGLTSSLMIPFCVLLFNLGLSGIDTLDPSSSSITSPTSQDHVSIHHLKTLLWGSTGTALAFFLASFQVHEKSILLVIAPASLLMFEFPTFVSWLSLVAMWSMWHLIRVDRLAIAYGACGILFIVVILPIFSMEEIRDREKKTYTTSTSTIGRFFESYFYARICKRLVKLYFVQSILVMILLHVAEVVYTPPINMPDLFPMIWSIAGCSMFCISWLITLVLCYQSMNEAIALGSTRDNNNNSKKYD